MSAAVIETKNTTGRFEAKFREVYQTGGGDNIHRIILRYYGTTKPDLETVSKDSKATQSSEIYHYATCDNMSFEEARNILNRGEYIEAVMYTDIAKQIGVAEMTAFDWINAVNVGIMFDDDLTLIGIGFIGSTCGGAFHADDMLFYWSNKNSDFLSTDLRDADPK